MTRCLGVLVQEPAAAPLHVPAPQAMRMKSSTSNGQPQIYMRAKQAGSARRRTRAAAHATGTEGASRAICQGARRGQVSLCAYVSYRAGPFELHVLVHDVEPDDRVL